MNTTHDSAFLKRRKFLMVLPMLVLPFATMAFWALGGGSKPPVAEVEISKGLNTVLPDAQLKGKNDSDKMSLYEQAQRLLADSAKQAGAGPIAPDVDAGKTDATELAINSRLAQIQAQVNSPAVAPAVPVKTSVVPSGNPAMSADVARLEKLMQGMKAGAGEEDPEMVQLNSMMDKILAIQNPDLVREAAPVAAAVSDSLFRAVPAEVVTSGKVTQGSVIELRLLDSVTINGQLLSAGHSVFGVAEFSNQRIALEIRNVRLGTSIIPVSLSTYDKRDAMKGINAPEALLSEAVGSGSVDAMNSIGLSGFDLGTQIAGAGLGAAKGLLSKKIRRVKQKIAAGYPVLLRDNSRKALK